MTQSFTGSPSTLTDGHILVGNSSNIATDVAMSGDVTIADTGVTAIKTSVALAGSPTTTTQAVGDNSTKIATTAHAAAGYLPQLGAASTTTKTLSRWSGTSGAALLSSTVQLSDLQELYNQRDYVITDTSTSRTLSASDIGCVIYFTNSSTITVTLPNSFLLGSYVTIIQGGTGQVQLAAASGATLQNLNSYTSTAKQYAQIIVEVVANSGGSAAIYNMTGDATLATGTFAKTVQQFSITIAASATSATATITAVTTANSFIVPGGQQNTTGTWDASTALCSLVLTNTTTVTATRGVSDSGTITITGTVVELVSGAVQSIQPGTCTYVTTATTATATITSVSTGNTFIVYTGGTVGSTSTSPAATLSRLTLTNSTTVTATRQTGTSLTSLTCNFIAVELKAGVVNSAVQYYSIANGALSQEITKVNPAYSFVISAGQSASSASAAWDGIFQWALINSYAVAQINASSGGTGNAFIIELDATRIKRVQRDIVQIPLNTTTGNTTILSADSTRTLLTLTGALSGSASTSVSSGNNLGALTQTSATNIRLTMASANASKLIQAGFEAVEFL